MNRNPEKFSSERKALRYRRTTCLNCGTTLKRTYVYCPNCSQLNSSKPLSAKDFLYEFLGIILFYDPKMRHTLWDLLFRPGVITKNYVHGQRLRYANPFRFFLTVSIIYFLLQGFLGSVSSTGTGKPLKLSLGQADTLSSDTADINAISDVFIPGFRGDTVMANQLGIQTYYSENTLDTFPFFERNMRRSSLYLQYHFKHQDEKTATALSKMHHINNFKNRFMYKRMIAVRHIIENPKAFLDFITAKMPFFLFFFTPVFALFFWMFYSRRKFTYMEHVIFNFHIFSFIFLGMLLLIIPGLFFDTDFLVGIFFFIVAPFYFYKALRNFYEQGRGITLLKFFLLSAVFIIGFVFTILLFVAASTIFYS